MCTACWIVIRWIYPSLLLPVTVTHLFSLLHCILLYILPFTYPFQYRWTFPLLPGFGCYCYCCSEYFSRWILLNICMHYFGYIPRSRIAESYACVYMDMFSLNWYCQRVFQSENFQNLFSHLPYMEFSSICSLTNTWSHLPFSF